MSEPTNEEMQKKAKDAVMRMVDFISSLADMDDRSAVILGAARVDVALEQMLKRVMRHHPGGQDNLFGVDRPLSSLSAKIALAHRLDLIDSEAEHGLQMLRKMRNDFAHSLETAGLSDGPQRNRVRELVRCTKAEDDKSGAWSYFIDKYPEALSHFCSSLTELLVEIEVLPEFVEYKVNKAPIGPTPPYPKPSESIQPPAE